MAKPADLVDPEPLADERITISRIMTNDTLKSQFEKLKYIHSTLPQSTAECKERDIDVADLQKRNILET